MLWQVPDIAMIGDGFVVDSLVKAEGIIIPPSTKLVIIGGYYEAGDGGSAEYNKVDSEPIHPGKFMSLDGAWWELTAKIPNIKMFGAIADGIVDDTIPISNMCEYMTATSKGAGDFGFGKSIVTATIEWPSNCTVIAENFIIDGSSMPASDSVFFCKGPDLVVASDLGANVTAGQQIIPMVSTVGISKGDRFVIYNPTNFSFNTARAYYRAGENIEVVAVNNDNTIRISRPLQGSYLANIVKVYRRSKHSINFAVSKFTVIGNDNILSPVSLILLDDIVLDNLSSVGGRQSINIERCYNGTGNGLEASQSYKSGIDDYGIVISNSENITVYGSFYGIRHGATQGGVDKIGCVPCRFNSVIGTISCGILSDGGAAAADAHGNAVNWTYGGSIFGGVNAGGNYGKCYGTIVSMPGYSAIRLGSECLGIDFDFSNSVVKDNGVNDANAPLINCSGMNANTVFGGIINLSNIKIYSPTQQRIISCRNDGYTAVGIIAVDLSGTCVVEANATCIMFFDNTAGVGGRKWSYIDVTGFVYPSNTTFGAGSSNGIDKVIGWVEKAVVNKVEAAPVNQVRFEYNWSRTPFAGIVPTVVWTLATAINIADGADTWTGVIRWNSGTTAQTTALAGLSNLKINIPAGNYNANMIAII